MAPADLVGKQFVDFECSTVDGEPAKLSDYAGNGKKTVVDFYTSW